jgi:hypothetical protein
MPWSAWLDAFWEEHRFSDPVPPVLLGPWQEWAIWNRIVGSAPEAADLLQPGATASAARQSWTLALQWRIDLARA